MVTITTPWRQQWGADSKGGEGKVALRDERKMMAGRGEDGWCKERSRGNGEGDVREAVQGQPSREQRVDGKLEAGETKSGRISEKQSAKLKTYL